MTTHTDKEIAKFDGLANEFWQRDGQFKTLHQINPIRLAFIEDYIDLASKRVADIGCGGGILAESLAAKGAVVTAIDLSTKGINAAQAQQQISGSNVDYRVQSTSELVTETDENQQFDAVFCMEMLEHVEHPETIVADCAALVKPGGLVVFSTINRTKKAHLLAVIVAEHLLRMVPQGTHDPNLFIKPSELQRMAETAGLCSLDITGFEYQPLARDFIRSDNTDINYIFAFSKSLDNPIKPR